MQAKNLRFRKWEDRHTHLFGKILLVYLSKSFGLDHNVMKSLQYSAYGRPFLDGAIDFNISHSGSMVICAMVSGARVGVDIEHYTSIDFSSFKNIHTDKQWKEINASKIPEKAFYDYWTIKESVIKAEGKGLSIPLHEIAIEGDQARFDGKLWHLKRLNINKDFACCVTSDQMWSEILPEEISQDQVNSKLI